MHSIDDNPVSQAEVQPWHRLGGVEHICELRKSSQVLYSIFVTILRTIYSSRKGRTFGCPDVVWSANSQKTEVWIDTELRWEDTRPDFTPAIYVCLGEIKYSFPPTLDMEARTFSSHDAERSYERYGTCAATILHVSDRAGAACSLADNTENYLSILQDQIRDEYCFERFVVTGRTPRQKKDQQQSEGKGKYVSAVTVEFEFSDAWTVKLETQILKAVSMMDAGQSSVHICGTNVDVANGQVEIEFGDMSTETDTPEEA